ncbi:MAG: pyridoxamine 5'-phosphate oxidase family protein [Erysipelotrichaceae bacterium]|nr:pyridoxamine 5'-phosphate oxidase family protein [Erysipelotrichaceae bacterium]
MNEVYDYLKKCGTYYLATVEDDQPRVRPFGTVCIFEEKLYIQTGKSKDVAKQIEKSPKVEICACDGPTWIRLAGTLVEDNRIAAQEAMLDDYPSLKNMYQAGDGNTVVYYFKDATATIASFTDEPKVYKF